MNLNCLQKPKKDGSYFVMGVGTQDEMTRSGKWIASDSPVEVRA